MITSPLGLGTLEMRPDRHPAIGAPFYYYSPLPRFDDGPERLSLLAPGYPVGVVVSASGTKWDLRGAYQAFRPYTKNGREHALAMSVVWGKRWD